MFALRPGKALRFRRQRRVSALLTRNEQLEHGVGLVHDLPGWHVRRESWLDTVHGMPRRHVS